MNVDAKAFSHAGRDRPNQDRYLGPISVGDHLWCAIVDGVGGRPNGDRAAAIAVDVLSTLGDSEKVHTGIDALEAMRRAFAADDVAVAREKPMAAAISILTLNDGSGTVFHLGDTRVYHLRNEGILRRTKDQTEVQELLDRGVVNKNQARRYHRKNVVTGFLAADRSLDLVAKTEFEVLLGDRFVMLTDGAAEVVPLRTIRDLSISNTRVSDFCDALEKTVINHNPSDDHSGLVLEIAN